MWVFGVEVAPTPVRGEADAPKGRMRPSRGLTPAEPEGRSKGAGHDEHASLEDSAPRDDLPRCARQPATRFARAGAKNKPTPQHQPQDPVGEPTALTATGMPRSRFSLTARGTMRDNRTRLRRKPQLEGDLDRPRSDHRLAALTVVPTEGPLLHARTLTQTPWSDSERLGINQHPAVGGTTYAQT